MSVAPGTPWPQPQVLVSLGGVHATSTEIITPVGTWPLREVNAYAHDSTRVTQTTPAWAIVLAVLLVWFFLLSLLLLLAKESKVTGYVTLTVDHGHERYVGQIPVSDVHQRDDAMQRAQYLQALIGHARSQG